MAIRSIQTQWTTPQEGDSKRLADILDGMARVEKSCLAFAGLTDSFGSELPDTITLAPPSPTILHYPVPGESVRFSQLNGGLAVWGHPGGWRLHAHQLRIAVLVCLRAQNSLWEIQRTLKWLDLIDQTYAANQKIDGTAEGCYLESGGWGPVKFAGKTYYGWQFTITVYAKYLVMGGMARQ